MVLHDGFRISTAGEDCGCMKYSLFMSSASVAPPVEFSLGRLDFELPSEAFSAIA